MLNTAPNWEELYRNTIYSVSHDLGAPCRHIRSFSTLLLEKDLDLDADSKKMLNHIHLASLETQAMLEGLLKLSRVYSRPTSMSVISANALAERFDCPIDSRQADTHICGNLDLLETAAMELADNAKLYGNFSGFELTTRPKWLSLIAIDKEGGIPDAEWLNSLRPLQRIGLRPNSENVGMGLSIAMAIAGQMKGTLTNQPRGVAIELPVL